jgi:large subunit ribosomal protein L25
MDMQRVVEDEEIRMNVPIHFLNADKAVGVRLAGGTVSQLMNDVEVVCLPRNLPEYFEIDIADLELDGMLHLSDLKLPEGVEIPELAHGPEHDHAIVSIHVIKAAPVEEEVEEEVEDEAAEEDEPDADDAGDEQDKD